MLTPQEFARLQKLAAISLNEEETTKLGKQLGTIVEFLGKLQEIPGTKQTILFGNQTLQPLSGVASYQDVSALFKNVTHEKFGNTIVVNSVIDN